MALVPTMLWLRPRIRAEFPLVASRWITLNRRWIIDGLRMAGLMKLRVLAKPQAIGADTNT